MTAGLVRRLSRSKPHRDSLLRNLASQLFLHGSITSTKPKLKEAQRYAERIITIAKQASKNPAVHTPELQSRLHLRGDTAGLVRKLVEEVGPRYAGRAGGYTRLLQLEPRLGDRAPAAILELVDQPLRGADGELQRGNMKLWLTVKAAMHAAQQGAAPSALTVKNLAKLGRGKDMEQFLAEVSDVRGLLLEQQGAEDTPEEAERFVQGLRSALEAPSPAPASPARKGYEFVPRPARN
ncbi:AaceriAEL162Wp [[Ashbya] aceris (nom. inval.)]|nr:AaceriAEL162Wp [[Ashbya] aceris (nom. inval.)]